MRREGAGLGATTRREHTHYTDPLREFTDWLQAEFGNAPRDLTPGKLQRFDHPDGRRGNLRCWCVLHLDGRPAGAAGDWREGSSLTWTADRRPLSTEDRQRMAAAAKAARAQRERERAQAQQRAAERARANWDAAAPATVAHPYLQAKQLPAVGVRESAGLLLVPLVDVHGTLHNLQRIDAAGRKRFLPGGRVRGLFCLLGTVRDGQPLYVCEGFATGASIGHAMQVPVACAMSANNLLPVAEALSRHYPAAALVVAADNDHRTEGNPGMRYGAEAARKVGAGLTWPTVCNLEGCTCTDFADTALCGRVPA
ncbi:toprim domain-containing protein [Pseudohaliea rubra]|uniref:DNA primase, phage-associated n=1 Tax=Pseudohaliea rubra DSM 19751 TaxID=1265313 RepID=A0A095VT62_9GAMM|nr:toprim domain-containing protein [Pseudohaliea rubra]KGE04545.1 DNA primase, phage-associated [Pseudohaliea rubra DSM 19751]